MNGYVIPAYLGYNIASMQNQLSGTAFLVKTISGRSSPLIDTTQCISVAVLHSRSTCDDHISEEVDGSLDGQINTSADSIVYRLSARIHSPAELQGISDTFLFISPVASTMELTNDVRGTNAPQAIVSFCC
jgi:hypothetical protein